MKSVLVTFDYPPIVGGIANALATFVGMARPTGCVILAPQAPGAAEFDADFPVPTIRFPNWTRLGFAGKALSFVAAVARTGLTLIRIRPDLFVAAQLVRAGPMALAWHLLSGRPYDVWVYGGETSAQFTSMRWLTRLLHVVLRRARTVFTNSQYTTQEMLAFGLREEAVVELPLGVDRSVFFPQEKSSALLEQYALVDKIVFTTIGRLVERKGVDTMLRALGELRDEMPPWHYLIVSDGPYRPQLESIVSELDLEPQVTFTGYVDQQELVTYFNLCDVFAMPNRQVGHETESSLSVEGFGMVFLEAAACSKPVIAGRSGGAVYALEDGYNGFSVDPENVEELKRAIKELMDPDRRRAMGVAGIDFASRFDWAKSAEILRTYI